MEVQSTETLLEEGNSIFTKCMADLITLLKRKFIQSLGFGCYLAKAKDKEKFIDELSLAGVVFIQCIHGLLNEDYVLGGITAEILQSDRKFYKELKLYSTDFEFWVHQNFKFAGFQVMTALNNSVKIRNSGLFLTPRSVYRMLSGFVNRVRLRPLVREKLYNASKTQEEGKEDEDENKTVIGGNVIAITSAEVEDFGKRCAKILFVKKEKGPNIKKIEENESWSIIRPKYQELLKPKALGALEFACTSSIYGKEFTLKYLENPMKRLYLLWLFGLVNRDHILFSLACNCLAFAVNDKNPFPPDGFNKWITTNFIFPRNKLLAGARFLKKLKSLELFFILPELEKTFVNLSFIETNPSEKLNLKDVVEGKWKKNRPKRVKNQVTKDQINDEMKDSQLPDECIETNSTQQVHLGFSDNTRFSEQSSVQQSYSWTGPDTNQGYYQPVQARMYIEGNGFVPSIPYSSEESTINYNTIIYQSEIIGDQALQNQTWNLPDALHMVTDGNACHLTNDQPLSNDEQKLTPAQEGTKLLVQSQTLHRSQIIPEPPPPPILSRMASPKTFQGSQIESDNNVDSILNWLEEKNKVVQEAMIKSVEAGHLEDLIKLAGAGGPDLVRKTRKPSTEESLLHIAAREDHESTVEFLVGHGGLDAKDHLGRTALHLAVLHGRVTIVEILLESGASSSIRDDQGKTPHDLAVDLDRLNGG